MDQGENRAKQGLLLKQTRESKGITLETVHEATKIPMDALRAIEEGYTVRTLTKFYYRGFVKMYAQFLGIELNRVFEDYEPTELPLPIHVREGRKSVFSKKPEPTLFAPELIQKIARIIVFLVILIFVFRMGGCIRNKFFPKTQGTKEKTVRVEKKNVPENKAEKKTPAAKKTYVKTEEQKAPLTSGIKIASPGEKTKKNIVVSARAKKKSWMRVESDGEVVFQSVLRQGVVETWTADERMELSGKNISELEFELNGKVIGSLGRQDRRAKKIIFTKNGFSVQQ